MNILQIRYVVKIAECGSIHSAARSLYISQPNLSNALKSLEEELHITIFERSARGVTLTSEGKAFIQNSQKLLQQIDAFDQLYWKHDTVSARKTFRMGMEFHPPVKNAWIKLCGSEKYKNYNMQMIQSNSTEMMHMLLSQELDVAIFSMTASCIDRLKRACAKGGFSLDVLHESHGYYIHIGKKHPLASKQSICCEDLCPYSRIDLGTRNYELVDPSSDIQDILNIDVPSKLTTDYETYIRLLQNSDFFSYGSDLYLENSVFSQQTGVISKKMEGYDGAVCIASIYNPKSAFAGLITDLHQEIRENLKQNFADVLEESR